MKSYLLDTHVFLWWLDGDKKLNKLTETKIKDRSSQIYVSVATMWEISIKNSAGKLPLKTSLAEMISLSGFELLPITFPHVLELGKLPPLHNDPFDRMLISQALTEHLTLVTSDSKIQKYKVPLLKA